jgi:WD40 repeat protein
MTSDVSFHRSAVGLKGGICMTHDLDRVDAPGSILSRSNATIESVSFNKTGSLLAVGDHLGMITLVDVRSAAPVSSLEGCSGRLSCVRFKSDHQLLTGGDDFVVRMFDDRKLREGAIGAFLGHTSAVSSIAVLDGLVFSGSLDGSVRVWSDAQVSGHGVKFLGAETEEHDATIAKAALIGHSQAVKSIAARKNGKAVEVLTGSSDTCVNIFVLN